MAFMINLNFKLFENLGYGEIKISIIIYILINNNLIFSTYNDYINNLDF